MGQVQKTDNLLDDVVLDPLLISYCLQEKLARCDAGSVGNVSWKFQGILNTNTFLISDMTYSRIAYYVFTYRATMAIVQDS